MNDRPDTADPLTPHQAASLSAWAPQEWVVASDWRATVDLFLNSPAARQLAQFIPRRLAQGAVIYPPQPLRALELTPLHAVRVVIIGQDPYHGPGQAEGLAFSVAPRVRVPPSLRNIFKERDRSVGQQQVDMAKPLHKPSGSLVDWARQGVLLLNTCLTVEQGLPASHSARGWEALTQAVVTAVVAKGNPVVFMLWGAHAQKLVPLLQAAVSADRAGIQDQQLLILTANHPSPLSALRPPEPFIGCEHFAKTNAFLVKCGVAPIVW
jgi:uracil-DNA glycosylase